VRGYFKKSSKFIVDKMERISHNTNMKSQLENAVISKSKETSQKAFLARPVAITSSCVFLVEQPGLLLTSSLDRGTSLAVYAECPGLF